MKTIAFIPARGGSKSIPLKNIKDFCGQPLIYWNLLALQNCENVDEIIVATGNDKIEYTVSSFGFKKVSTFRRSKTNAQDDSTTESVMLEFLKQSKEISAEDIFLLVQATSPFTQSTHFSQALHQFSEEPCDSLLSVTRSKRFFWNPDGTPLNYNPQARPRRQDHDGIFMENGAFYISNVKNILQSSNRLSGKISLYEMPEYTSLELDENDDWLLGETLHKKYLSNI